MDKKPDFVPQEVWDEFTAALDKESKELLHSLAKAFGGQKRKTKRRKGSKKGGGKGHSKLRQQKVR